MPRISPFAQIRYRPIVQAVLDQAGVSVDPSEWDVHTNGSAHTVINAGHLVSVRIAKTRSVAQRVERRTELLRALPADLPFQVPRPLTRILTRGGFTAVGLTWVPGRPRPTGPAPTRTLGRAMRAIYRVDPEPLRGLVDESCQHWGGSDWARTLRRRVVPLLREPLQPKALRFIDEALALDPVPHRLVHADFAGHNILWQKDRVSGVIDWDHATIGDPTWDIAAAGNWYGWETLTRVVGRPWADRGRVLQRLMPLQSVGYTVVNDLGGALQRQAVDRAETWVAEH